MLWWRECSKHYEGSVGRQRNSPTAAVDHPLGGVARQRATAAGRPYASVERALSQRTGVIQTPR